METAKLTLKDFGVERLTLIEERQLREDIKKTMDHNTEIRKNGNDSHDVSLMLWPFAHAYENFLLHYGINLHDLPVDPKIGNFRKDPVLMQHLREKLRKAREEAHKPYLN